MLSSNLFFIISAHANTLETMPTFLFALLYSGKYPRCKWRCIVFDWTAFQVCIILELPPPSVLSGSPDGLSTPLVTPSPQNRKRSRPQAVYCFIALVRSKSRSHRPH